MKEPRGRPVQAASSTPRDGVETPVRPVVNRNHGRPAWLVGLIAVSVLVVLAGIGFRDVELPPAVPASTAPHTTPAMRPAGLPRRSAAPLPTATLPEGVFAGSGNRTAEATGRCDVATGDPPLAGGENPCIRSRVPSGLFILSVPTGTIVQFAIPGWELHGWSVACGNGLEEVLGSVLDDATCSLGEGTGSPARFASPDGEHVVVVYATLTREGSTIFGAYFVTVIVRAITT